MKTLGKFATIFMLLVLAKYASGQEKGLLVGVFDGRTPCQELAARLEEKTGPQCIKIKWRLTLYKDNDKASEGNYEMFGFVYKKESPRKGRWHLVKGTAVDPNAVVLQLDEAGKPPLLLLKVDDNIFYFLDKDRNLFVGNRDFSFTLNRVPVKP